MSVRINKFLGTMDNYKQKRWKYRYKGEDDATGGPNELDFFKIYPSHGVY